MEIEKKLNVWVPTGDKSVRYKEYTITFHADLFGKKVSAEYVCYSYWHFSRPPWAKSENDYNHGKRTPRTLYIYIDEKKVYRWKNPEIYEIYNKFFCGKK